MENINKYKKTLAKIAAIFSIIAVFSFGFVDSKSYADGESGTGDNIAAGDLVDEFNKNAEEFLETEEVRQIKDAPETSYAPSVTKDTVDAAEVVHKGDGDVFEKLLDTYNAQQAVEAAFKAKKENPYDQYNDARIAELGAQHKESYDAYQAVHEDKMPQTIQKIGQLEIKCKKGCSEQEQESLNKYKLFAGASASDDKIKFNKFGKVEFHKITTGSADINSKLSPSDQKLMRKLKDVEQQLDTTVQIYNITKKEADLERIKKLNSERTEMLVKLGVVQAAPVKAPASAGSSVPTVTPVAVTSAAPSSPSSVGSTAITGSVADLSGSVGPATTPSGLDAVLGADARVGIDANGDYIDTTKPRPFDPVSNSDPAKDRTELVYLMAKAYNDASDANNQNVTNFIAGHPELKGDLGEIYQEAEVIARSSGSGASDLSSGSGVASSDDKKIKIDTTAATLIPLVEKTITPEYQNQILEAHKGASENDLTSVESVMKSLIKAEKELDAAIMQYNDDVIKDPELSDSPYGEIKREEIERLKIRKDREEQDFKHIVSVMDKTKLYEGGAKKAGVIFEDKGKIAPIKIAITSEEKPKLRAEAIKVHGKKDQSSEDVRRLNNSAEMLGSKEKTLSDAITKHNQNVDSNPNFIKTDAGLESLKKISTLAEEYKITLNAYSRDDLKVRSSMSPSPSPVPGSVPTPAPGPAPTPVPGSVPAPTPAPVLNPDITQTTKIVVDEKGDYVKVVVEEQPKAEHKSSTKTHKKADAKARDLAMPARHSPAVPKAPNATVTTEGQGDEGFNKLNYLNGILSE